MCVCLCVCVYICHLRCVCLCVHARANTRVCREELGCPDTVNKYEKMLRQGGARSGTARRSVSLNEEGGGKVG